MRHSLCLSFLAIGACDAGSQESPSEIINYEDSRFANLDDREAAQIFERHWFITVQSGYGLPGSPGADEFVRDAKNAIQGIVDDCQLGQTVWSEGTDGMSLILIDNPELEAQQVTCLRQHETDLIRINPPSNPAFLLLQDENAQTH